MSIFCYGMRKYRIRAFKRGYSSTLYRIRTYWYRYCDRYKILVESRTVLYSNGIVKIWVRDFWYGISAYRIRDKGRWYSIVLYRTELERIGSVTTTFESCGSVGDGGKRKNDLLSDEVELIFMFSQYNN